MNELDRIREQIKRMRTKGVEPNYVIMCYDLWDSLGRPHRFSGAGIVTGKQIGRAHV